MATIDPENNQVDHAVAEGGAYAIIRKRLSDQGNQLKASTTKLNQARLQEFGGSEMSVIARTRVRTENNCMPRDIVQVGELLLFGYNVFIGLKTETKVSDVFSLFAMDEQDGQPHLHEAKPEGTFLADKSFVNDFDELYRYYKNTSLLQLTIRNGKLLAAFQIGERIEDIRVFRWGLSADGKTATYIDNRGERDIQLPPSYDFEWTSTTREDVINGPHPHVNILDQLFVETVGGDLTVKIENNTRSGRGIYSEGVNEQTQSIDDAEFQYAELGSLILLRIRPYREPNWRHLVYNKLTNDVIRIDAIGQSCVQLPEDHGIIFPGGYYLQTGQCKTFDDDQGHMQFKRMIRSPNGEDVLYVFYELERGIAGLHSYNMISKELQNPIYGDGYALADDGTMVVFAAMEEPTRVHPMQIWKTPFFSDEFASKIPPSQSFYGRIGNPDLVRGISDLYALSSIIDNQSVTVRLYEELRRSTLKIFDDHYWLSESELEDVKNLLHEVEKTADLAIDEFEKVESIRQQSATALEEAIDKQNTIIAEVQTGNWEDAEDFVSALDKIRRQRGHLATIKDYRYIDHDKILSLDEQLQNTQTELSERTIQFLADEKSLLPYEQKLATFNADIEKSKTVAELTPITESIEKTASALDLLSDLLSTIKVSDATVRTRIIDGISSIYSKLNQCKASAGHKQKSLGSAESVAQFSAQFKLFSQSITNALGLANTPEACDEQMARLLIQLEDLESQFSDHEDFLSDIIGKREEVQESFESHKQRLLDERQRKAQSIVDAAGRLLKSIERRSQKFSVADELNTYFASDALVIKIREFVERLRELDSNVQADDIDAQFKGIKDQSQRSLRDKTDLFENDGNVIKLGPKHRFSINTQELDLTILPRGGELFSHLTGTNFYQKLDSAELTELRDFWEVSIESESDELYRGEFLAESILNAAQLEQDGLSQDKLKQALLDPSSLEKLVKDYAGPRYKEGYEKGIHDHDATLILQMLIPALEQIDYLSYDPFARGFAQVFWANLESVAVILKKCRLSYDTWVERAKSATHMRQSLASAKATNLLSEEIFSAMEEFISYHPIKIDAVKLKRAADYLVLELGREHIQFIGSKYAHQLVNELKRSVNDDSWRRYQSSLEKMHGWPAERWQLSSAWLQALVEQKQLGHLTRYIPEAAALINSDDRLERRPTEADLDLTVDGLMGSHKRIQDRSLSFSIDDFLDRCAYHRQVFIPSYHKYLHVRQAVLDRERAALRLNEYKPRPLSSFVRNKLINESYLPIIGDNLAKQMGTVGEKKRSDLMGLLMMISPPGYGKTTLMEYVANRLGLIFMKINCPSLGHDVLSLDPKQAPNATARQELIKLNLSLEMGNNVMLYLDDIQHTHPEFLQKFISLCDGTRRIEGIWEGETKTYDMRGRKFCVVMAGNPYTESGEMFKIPDMLANRADIYNLGDILGGMDEYFALSYIENALTSNPVLAPLATRDINDVYLFVKMAQGENIATTDLSHQYSGAEVSEIVDVLKKLFSIRDVILKVNKEYIRSAAQADKYRTEPPFKLQGSYRNMSKMAEKISAIMNEQELQQLIHDHYIGEAQLLTAGAEENLLKLAELRGVLDENQSKRWQQIKDDFTRARAMGGDDADSAQLIIGQLLDLVNAVKALPAQVAQMAPVPQKINEEIKAPENEASEKEDSINTQKLILVMLDKLKDAIEAHQPKVEIVNQSNPELSTILKSLTSAIASNKPQVEVINQPVPGIDLLLRKLTESIETSLYPIVRSMDKKMEIDLRTHYKMKEVAEKLGDLKSSIRTKEDNGSKRPKPKLPE